jgi:hypothetical protein
MIARMLGLALAVVALVVVRAGPAAADQSDYLQTLQPKYAYLTQQQLMTEGNKVCRATHSGSPASDIVPRVQKDLAVSVSVASDVVTTAIVHLGC